MRVRDVMSRDVHIASPGDTLQEVARQMASGDFGFVPVCEGDRLIGAVTDRDIVVRAVAQGAPSTAPIVEYATRDVRTVREDDDLREVLDRMGSDQIRRLVVIDRDERVCGVVSLGDLAETVKEKHAGETLEDISRASANN